MKLFCLWTEWKRARADSASRARPTTCYNDLQRCMPVTHRRQSRHALWGHRLARTRSRAPRPTTSVGPMGSAATKPSAAASRNCSIKWAERLAAGNPTRQSMNGGLRLRASRTPKPAFAATGATCATPTTAAAIFRSIARLTAATTRLVRPTTGRAPDGVGSIPILIRLQSAASPEAIHRWPRVLQRRHRQPAQRQMPGRRRTKQSQRG